MCSMWAVSVCLHVIMFVRLPVNSHFHQKPNVSCLMAKMIKKNVCKCSTKSLNKLETGIMNVLPLQWPQQWRRVQCTYRPASLVQFSGYSDWHIVWHKRRQVCFRLLIPSVSTLAWPVCSIRMFHAIQICAIFRLHWTFSESRNCVPNLRLRGISVKCKDFTSSVAVHK